MAELTSGAVSSLLGLLQKEAQLLGGVGSDVDFIREEMESMNSFLEHLSMTAHLAGGQHDKQVRTWMKQVRDLAHDCSNCVDNYVRSGDLAVHLARGGLRRYFWWTYWLLMKAVAQHTAAMRLRELKDRVSDVGKRRQRYGVEIPGKAAGAGQQVRPDGAAAEIVLDDDDEEDEDDLATQNQVAAVAAGGPAARRRRDLLEPRTLEGVCAQKLVSWFSNSQGAGQSLIPSIAIVAPPDADTSAAAAIGALGLATYFDKTVSVNLDALHHSWDLPLLPREILYYILRECEQQGTDQGEGRQVENKRWEAYGDRSTRFDEIWENVDKCGTHIQDKIRRLKSEIGELPVSEAENKKPEQTKRGLRATADDTPLGILHRALRHGVEMMGPSPIGGSTEDIVQEAATMLKLHMEDGVPDELLIRLDDIQYQDVLRKVFLDSKTPHPQAQEISTNNDDTATITLGEDHIREILSNHKITLESHKVALDIIRELLPRHQIAEANSAMEQAKAVLQGGSHQNGHAAIDAAAIKGTEEKMDETKANNATAAAMEEAKLKVDRIYWPIKLQLFIKVIVDKINVLLQSKRTMIILIDDRDYISEWERIRNALSLLTCAHGSAVIVITKNSQKAKEFCCPPVEPVTYSLVRMYHDIVLEITSPREDEGSGSNSQIILDILGKCHPNEFCMRMFAHALWANPNRSNEELRSLNATLQVSDNSMATDATNAKAIFKFSYRDLPREHKTCLLYLAVFPQGHIIKRSTLVERWAMEGLITKEDWPTVVRHARRCFQALIDRQFVIPFGLSAAGKVKSCTVGAPIHEFITKIANKERILDARLSQLRARHFSTFSGLRLRASDSIDTVVQKLRPKYLHKLRVLKLLDLEGCQCLEKNHLRDICSTILRLKYLSLRGTNVTNLPGEINNLHELEILDIRQTKVRECATRGIVLLKLRRLLAGQIIDPSTSDEMGTIHVCQPSLSAVDIPRKINKMENIEVLSNVKAYSRDGAELKEIRKLGQLRKLGVVIHNKKNHLRNLLWAVSDLKECLHSLSITIHDGTPTKNLLPQENKKLLPQELYSHLIQPPKVLESLSIDGSTDIVRLLTLFAKGSDELTKVTLSRTLVEPEKMIHIVGRPKLHSLRLRHNAYKGTRLNFEKEEFPHLKNFIVEWLHGTDIINFVNGAATELERIVLFHTDIKHLNGVSALPKLKELELKRNTCLVLLPEDGATAAEPVKPEDGTVSAEPITAPKGGTKSAEPDKPEDATTPVEPVKPEDGTTSAEPGKPEDGTSSAEPVTNQSTLTFKKGEFKHLEYFLVQGAIMQTDIKFEGGAPELEKIVLSDTNINSLVGVSGLAKLREIDLKGNRALLLLFASANHIAKVTLSDTCLNQDDLQILAKKPKLCFLELLKNSYDGHELTFNKADFPKLKHLIVKCLDISKISFLEESACKLEKIVWSFNEMESLSGIDKLQELKELEFNGDSVPFQVRRDINAHKKRPIVVHNKP